MTRETAWANWEAAQERTRRAFRFAEQARGTEFEQRAQEAARRAAEAQEQAWAQWTQAR